MFFFLFSILNRYQYHTFANRLTNVRGISGIARNAVSVADALHDRIVSTEVATIFKPV